MQTKLTTEDTENTELNPKELRNPGNGISVIEARR
jgi:hypothetical protein